jgi:predicted transcriptional regulator of viral defense system
MMRVATIGRTFLDMIREPELCGGIYHVLEVYAEYAQRYLRLIVDVIDRHGSKIDKVRAGYILDERLELPHANSTIESWRALVQRGGSRKLQANAPYSSRFSEKWCLSINIEEAEEA